MKKHKLSYSDLIKGKSFSDYAEEVTYIYKLIENGSVTPIKSSGTNGKKPAMYRKFWKFESETDYSKYEDELKYRLSVKINPQYYLKHPEVYDYERKFVLQLSEFLENRISELDSMMSVNERSYSIWRLEKFLSGQKQIVKGHDISALSILRHCAVLPESLNVYKTAEPMAYFSISKDYPQNILIVENLDPFYSMRKFILSGGRDILGMKFSTLIYGGGKRVSGIFSDFDLMAEDYLKAVGNRFFYFGDLDYEGIGIYESFAGKASVNVEIFAEAYRALLEDTDIDSLPDSKELQNKNISNLFWSFFNDTEIKKMQEILKKGKYIPQEKLSILSYTH